MLVEYSLILIGFNVLVMGIVCYMAVKAVTNNANELQKIITAVSGKSREYGEIKAIDKAYEDIKVKPKVKQEKKEEEDKLEDMLL
jgi:hypothetical protein